MNGENGLFTRHWQAGDENVAGVVLETEAGAFLIIHRILLTKLGGQTTNHQVYSSTVGPISAAQARASLVAAADLEARIGVEPAAVEPTPPAPAEPEPPPPAPEAPLTAREQELAEDLERWKARRTAVGKSLRAVYDRSGLTGQEMADLFFVSRAQFRKWMSGDIAANWMEPLDKFAQLVLPAIAERAIPVEVRAWLLAEPNGKRSLYEALKQQQYTEFAERAAATQIVKEHTPQAKSLQEAAARIQALSGLSVKSIVALLKMNGSQFYSWLRGEGTHAEGIAARRIVRMAEVLETARGSFKDVRQFYYWLLTPQDGKTPYQVLQDDAYEEFLRRARNVAAPAIV